MVSITGYSEMGMQLVAGDARQCVESGRSISATGAWAFAAAAADFGTKPATRHLTDVPMNGTRRPRSSQ